MIERDLSQCTPMIHFQAGEEGATLRATEVKPKLDRFIYRWCKKKGTEIKNTWLVEAKTPDNRAERHRALDYKLRFVAQGAARIAEPMKGLFFGNIGGEEKKTVFYEKPIHMTILCLHTELEKILEECVDLFFLTTNFGTRQNKGFGGFVTEKRQEAEGQLAWWFGTNRVYKLQYPGGTSVDKIMNDIRVIYQVLKSGYNFREDYIKSFLTTCFLERNIGGEKRYIKHTGVGPSIGRRPQGNVNEFLYIRGLFGVGDEQMWQEERGRGRTKIKFLCEGETLERVPSPLLFKIVRSTLYMILTDLPEKVGGTKYRFKNGRNESEYIPIPTKEKLHNLGLEMETILQRYVSELNGNGNHDIRAQMQRIHRASDVPQFVQNQNLQFVPVD